MGNEPLTESERIVENRIEAEIRAKNCLLDIQNILHRWNCAINPVVEVSSMGIRGSFQVVAMPVVPKDLIPNGKKNN